MKKPFEHFEVKESIYEALDLTKWAYKDLHTIKILKAILKRNQDPTFGTYDYDGIAVEVIKLVTKK